MLIEFLHSFSDGEIRRNHYDRAAVFVHFCLLLQIQLLFGYFGVLNLTYFSQKSILVNLNKVFWQTSGLTSVSFQLLSSQNHRVAECQGLEGRTTQACQQLFGVFLTIFFLSFLEHVGALDAQNIVAVSCGEAHTLALNDKGQVYAWGLATDGQLGLPGTEECIRVPRLKILSL